MRKETGCIRDRDMYMDKEIVIKNVDQESRKEIERLTTYGSAITILIMSEEVRDGT